VRTLFVRVAYRAALIVAIVQLAGVAVFLWWDHRVDADRERDRQAAVIAAVVAVTTNREDLRTTLTRTSPSGRLAVHLTGQPPVGPTWASAAAVVDVMRRSAPITVKAGDGRSFLAPVTAAGGGTAVVEIYLPDAGLDPRTLVGTAAFALIGLVATALAILSADRQAAPVVEEIRSLGAAATSIDARELAYRQPPGTVPELAAIAGMINRVGTLARHLADRERKMIADVSHRLRTPLTALRLDADAVGSGQVAERIRSAIASLEHDVGDIIRAASRPQEPARPAIRTCDLTEVVGRRMQFWQVLAANQNRRCDISVTDTPTPVGLAEDDVADIVNNLVGNVFRHTQPGTPMAITVGQHAGWISLVVDDGGPGIADPEKALRRGVSGGGSTGLGLDIVRTKVEAAGGTIHIERGKLGGARVRLRFAESGLPHESKLPLAWRLWRGHNHII
jgi:signal transduction histidine kinase